MQLQPIELSAKLANQSAGKVRSWACKKERQQMFEENEMQLPKYCHSR
jgi:hypothetical protein